MHSLVPATARRVLDVGCNDGGFGRWLLRHTPGVRVWGIEPNGEQAELARAAYAGVVTGYFPEALRSFDESFDCIAFNHVLEHMEDPWSALRESREYLAEGACVIAVIPNVRYVRVLADLSLRGRWEYEDAGILDRTHLRFFTRRSVISLFEDSGFRINSLTPVNGIGSVSYPRLATVASWLLRDLAYGGFAVQAVPST